MRKSKVSAFAVLQEQKGKHKLDDDVKKELSQAVKVLHEDKKFNKNANRIGTTYERNVRQTIKKTKQKRIAQEKALKQAKKLHKQQEKEKENSLQEVQLETEASDGPLNWYGGPKSKQPRQKFKQSTESLPADIRGKKGGKKRQLVEDEILFQPVPKLPKVTRPGQKKQSVIAQLYADKESRKQNKNSNYHQDNDVMNGDAFTESDILLQNGDDKKAPKKSQKKQKLDLSSPAAINRMSAQVGLDSDEDDEMLSHPEILSEVDHSDPEKEARELFANLIHPMKPKAFFENYWLKKPLHIKRKNKDYYKEDDWFSTDELDRILSEERVRFGVNIDLTTYKNGKRETLNPAGRAYPAIVWDHYNQGCSVRLLNPQTYSDTTWLLLSTLQELFGCMVGANVYLTPPGTQGFAPHYDDIEAFVLQLEGKKHWKVYGPRTDSDVWALTSSRNMTQEELGQPILDCVLEPGDLLYFPRGAIHQALTQNDEHSLHITVSTHQRNSWSDLLQLMLPAALANATEVDPEFRESLPNDYLNYTGIAFQEQEGPARTAFMGKIQKLMEKLMSYAPVDGACDLMAKKFIHDSLPPCLTETERMLSVAEQGEKWVNGEVRDNVELQPDTRVRLMRRHCLRIVNEPVEEEDTDCRQKLNTENKKAKNGNVDSDSSDGEPDDFDSDHVIRVYYSTDNDRLYHGNELQYFEVNGELAPAIEYLQLQFPNFVSIDDLPLEDVTHKVDVAMQLYDRGLILTEESLEPYDMSEGEEDGSESEGDEDKVDDDEEEDAEEEETSDDGESESDE